jgi:DNA polymerase-4
MKETGLPLSFGLSTNKTVSKIATGEAKPNGELHVPYSRVKYFLSPLSIRKIPMIGDKTYRLLRSMGIVTIKTLSMIPPEMMEKVMGKNGIIIWRKANGIDPSPVRPYSEKKSIGTEKTFDRDTIDINRLKDILTGMVESTAFELRQKGRLAGNVTVKIRYSNYDTHTLRKKIAYTSFDHILINTSLELFERLYNRRMLIRLIGVRFSDLVTGYQQLDIFNDAPQLINLYQAMDKIRQRFGADAVKRAVLIQ